MTFFYKKRHETFLVAVCSYICVFSELLFLSKHTIESHVQFHANILLLTEMIKIETYLWLTSITNVLFHFFTLFTKLAWIYTSILHTNIFQQIQ